MDKARPCPAKALRPVIHGLQLVVIVASTHHLTQTAAPVRELITIWKSVTVYRVVQDTFVRYLSPSPLDYLLSILQRLFFLSPKCRASPCNHIPFLSLFPLLVRSVLVYKPLTWPR